ncbi:hypothetical protein N431DRAFT_414719 [Stipitochalara longipes BDJ]|nr:hypothetical protein N431DRAFT_414719 [Stipitochalara longipes BDJ]
MSPSNHQPALACETCKSRKRKCDKALPKCSLCTSKRLSCRYPTVERHSQNEPQYPSPESTSSSAVSPSNAAAATSALLPNNFPPVFYLDWDVFQRCQIEIEKPYLPLPTNISNIIGNAENWESIAAEYFSTTHTWMPIISKKRLYEHIRNHLGQIRLDYAFLLLAMDLICWIPDNNDPRTPTYLAAKSFYLDLEIQGFVSLHILQAEILIALFEFGHAIYPSATVSIEACVRYGHSLGINWDSKFPAKRLFSWVDGDEQNRVWWAVIILDRISRIGFPRRPLLTEDPNPESILPSDDKSWDEGVMPPKCFNVLHPDNPRKLGQFALKAEATRLLGQVIRHVESPTFGNSFHAEEGLLLDGALRALVTVTEFEGQNHNLDVMNQTAMCSIGLILLHEAHASRNSEATEYFERIHHTKHVTKLVQNSANEMTSGGEASIKSCVKSGSPFMTILLYQVATANLRICQDQAIRGSYVNFAVMKDGLKAFDERWRASGAFLKILEAREVLFAC